MLLRSVSLNNTLISLLSSRVGATASWLQEQVAREYKACSIQAIYKELRRLQRGGIIVKEKDRYSLSLTWVFDIIKFAEKLDNAYLKSPPVGSIIPEKGRRKIWHFSDLGRLDDFWVQVMLSLYHISKKKKMFQWVPHPWFHLLHHEKEMKFQMVQKMSGNKLYMIVGGRTYLDRTLAKYWAHDVYQYSLAKSPFEHKRSIFYNVIDDYILTIRMDKITTQKVDDLFDKVKSAKDLKPGMVVQIFNQKAKITMTLERNLKKANQLKQKFCLFFGVKLKDF